jgi:hypothetical protein
MIGKNNIWEWQAKDKDGKVVETAPGMKSITMRGPGTLPDLIASANLFLYCKRLDAVRIGLPDPGYTLDLSSIKPLGHTDQTDQDLGVWAPTNALPVSLPTDPAVRAAHEKLIAERLGMAEMIPLPEAPPGLAAAPPLSPARPKAK